VSGARLDRMGSTVAKIAYEGDIHVRPYHRGTYLGAEHLETLIEKALGERYSYGRGWDGHAVVSIEFREAGSPPE